MSDWKKLRKLAEAATPGTWEVGAAGACNVVMFNGDDIVGITAAFAPENRSFIAAANPTTILALLDENERLRSDEATMKLSRMLGLGDPVRPDIHAAVCRQRDSLRAEVERLRMQHGIACGAAEAMTGAFERSQQQLAAALAAKEEACEIAMAGIIDPDDRERIIALRSIGKDGGNG